MRVLVFVSNYICFRTFCWRRSTFGQFSVDFSFCFVKLRWSEAEHTPHWTWCFHNHQRTTGPSFRDVQLSWPSAFPTLQSCHSFPFTVCERKTSWIAYYNLPLVISQHLAILQHLVVSPSGSFRGHPCESVAPAEFEDSFKPFLSTVSGSKMWIIRG